MYSGFVSVPGHQLLRLRSLDARPLEKLPEQGELLRKVPQSSRQGMKSVILRPSSEMVFTFWLNSSPLPQPPCPVLI